MSIDARIIGVTKDNEGKVWLNLEDRDNQHSAGQTRLEILNPFQGFALHDLLIGKEIWGGSSFIMIGQRQIAVRNSYCSITIDYVELKEALKS